MLLSTFKLVNGQLDDGVCLVPFVVVSLWNSLPYESGPLPETICSGIPNKWNPVVLSFNLSFNSVAGHIKLLIALIVHSKDGNVSINRIVKLYSP